VSLTTTSLPAGGGHGRRFLSALGRGTRARARFTLTVVALGFGVLCEIPQATSWRRPVRAEFARVLRQAVGGGLLPTGIAAALIGILMVYQALLWLGEAGQEALIGSILVSVLVREVTPLLVGLIILGRSGVVAAAELGPLRRDRQIEQLFAQGVDPFLLLILPRAAAFAVASYTLSILFVVTAMFVGVSVGNIAGGVRMSSWEFSFTVLGAMQPADFVIFPAKMLIIGLLIGLISAATALSAPAREATPTLLPHVFARGLVAIILTSLVLSFAL
jgi:phospholipid/cholesterol/gamma-HCH transport system permease protein